MTRLLYVIASLGAGGSERQLSYLVRALRAEQHQVGVAVWNFHDDDPYVEPIRATGATVFALQGSFLRKLRQIRRLIREQSIDVVHSFSFYLNPVVAAAAAMSAACAVGSVRSTFATARELSGHIHGRIAARWPRRQVYNSRGAVAEAQRARVFRPARIAYVQNHLDVDGIAAVELPAEPCVAAIGSLLPYKRWDRLIAASARLRDAGFDFRVLLAGEGPLRAELELQIGRLGLRDRVTLLGHVRDVPGVVAGSWFVVHTSDTEGSPNVVMEAMAAGRAIVATPVGDVPGLIRDGESGYLARDENELVARMAELLRDRDLCSRMGKRARETVRERVGTESLATQMLDAYRMLGWR